MDKYQNAIGVIKACGLNIKGSAELLEDVKQIENTIIEALEKQIQKPKTNYDRIRNMNVDELAEFLEEFKKYRCPNCAYHYEEEPCFDKYCENGLKQWLESEVDTNDR